MKPTTLPLAQYLFFLDGWLGENFALFRRYRACIVTGIFKWTKTGRGCSFLFMISTAHSSINPTETKISSETKPYIYC